MNQLATPNPATPAAQALARALADPCAVAKRHGSYLTPDRVQNLARLASYLRTLPDDYEHFGMGSFYSARPDNRYGVSTGERPVNVSPASYNHCGTSACAVGHGPGAGLPAKRGEGWAAYSHRCFVDPYPVTSQLDMEAEQQGMYAWHGLFSGEWSRVDDTARGAAARIAMMLAGDSTTSATLYSAMVHRHRTEAKAVYAEYLP